MDSTSVSFNMEDQKPIFTLAGDPNPTSTTDSFPFPDTRNIGTPEGVMSSMTPMMHGLGGNELMNLLAQQEPKIADSAPSVADMEELLTNMRMNGSDVFNDDASVNNYFTGYGSRSESGSSNIWPDNANMQNSRNNEMMDTFDFLVKSLSSANNYVSMLTREQLSVLRSIRPSLLYEFLQEVAKARSDRRMRRALPNECAFCKNNGENEECYSSHALKDWRGKVLCPVLRAFRCPRCGATGDRAHTIKYCPEGGEQGTGGLASRRRAPPSTSLLFNNGASRSQAGTAAPSASPVASPANPSLSYSSLWSNFGLN